MSRILLPCLVLLLGAVFRNLAAPVERDLSYKTGPTDYERTSCTLDLFVPAGRKDFPTLVWLHGGGMTQGNKEYPVTQGIARRLAEAGIGVAAANYRLSPGATFPSYVEDAAAAFAWVHGHIAAHGGDAGKVFLGGHSAGGYLAALVGMDTRYLRKLNLGQDAVAGLIPMSGQIMTHFTVRAERGIDANTIIADEAAPIYYTRADTPPFLILLGDRDWPARLEENQHFAAALRAAKNRRVELRVFADRDHGSIAARMTEPGDPVAAAVIEFIERVSKGR